MPKNAIKENIELAPLTTMRVGGPARYFASIKNESALRSATLFARRNNIPVFVLGGGSNIVMGDGGFPGLVLKLEQDVIEYADYLGGNTLVIADAGVMWDDLVSATVERGLYGLENLSRIPGTVGAAPVQNIGAYGAELSSTLVWVEVFDTITRTTHILTNAECNFAYRDSIFKKDSGKHLIITKAAFLVRAGGTPNIEYRDLKEYFKKKTQGVPSLSDIRTAITEIRSRKLPPLDTYGTVGSFFKNPIITAKEYERLKNKHADLPGYPQGAEHIKIPLAWILDTVCGWKGFRSRGVGVYHNQPLVLVNFGGAHASEIVALSRAMHDDVYDHTGIEIMPEVSFVGDFH